MRTIHHHFYSSSFIVIHRHSSTFIVNDLSLVTIDRHWWPWITFDHHS